MYLIDRYKGVDKLVAAAELSLAAPVVGDPSVATEVGPQPRRDSAGFGSLRRAQNRMQARAIGCRNLRARSWVGPRHRV